MKTAFGIVLGILLGYVTFCVLTLIGVAIHAGLTGRYFDAVEVILLCLAPVITVRCNTQYDCTHQEPVLVAAAAGCVLLLVLGGFAGWRWAQKHKR